jgi:ketosteroid isomerase-like protein
MTTTTSQTEISRALMARIYKAAAAGDYEDVLGCVSADIVITEPGFLPYGGVYRGIDRMREAIGKLAQLLDVSKMVVDRLVADEDRVIGIVRIPDLKTGEYILLAEEALIKDGKVSEICVYFNETRSLLDAPKL